MRLAHYKIKLLVGVLIGGFFLFLAVHKVNFPQMLDALIAANYWYLFSTIPVLFFSHILRALRWRYLLDPIRRFDIGSLFSSLIIGYMANAIMPAHLGEVLRAYTLCKKKSMSASSIFATIVTERILDMFALLALMLFAIFIYPFPEWLKKSGYILFTGTLGLFLFLVLLKNWTSKVQKLLSFFIKPLPKNLQIKIWNMLEMFLKGFVPLNIWSDYIVVGILSLLIWFCYGLMFFFMLHAFDFIQTYSLPWSASLILLVITTIGIVVPSSPGYVGTYHYLCQITLVMFTVPASSALSFAAVAHGINFFPVLAVGLVFSYYEGIQLTKINANMVPVETT